VEAVLFSKGVSILWLKNEKKFWKEIKPSDS
jgi:hypothetical protein